MTQPQERYLFRFSVGLALTAIILAWYSGSVASILYFFVSGLLGWVFAKLVAIPDQRRRVLHKDDHDSKPLIMLALLFGMFIVPIEMRPLGLNSAP